MPVEQSSQPTIKICALVFGEGNVIINIPIDDGIQAVVKKCGAGAGNLGQQYADQKKAINATSKGYPQRWVGHVAAHCRDEPGRDPGVLLHTWPDPRAPTTLPQNRPQ